jgi:hypothetical protein
MAAMRSWWMRSSMRPLRLARCSRPIMKIAAQPKIQMITKAGSPHAMFMSSSFHAP